MRFSKIKWDGKAVILRWTTRENGGETEVHHELESRQQPHPDFTAAIAAFVMPVLDLLELPPEYAHSFSVVGLSLNEEDDGRGGIVVTCFKKLAETNAPLVLNTPHLREAGDEPEGLFMPSHWLKLIETAEKAAEQFVKGQREQLSLLAS